VSTVSNRVFWTTAVNRTVVHRPWLTVAAAAGVLLAAIAVVLAGRVWSATNTPTEDQTVTPDPNADQAVGLPALPRRVPRAPRETVIDLRSAAALIPRQTVDRAF
jgi:Protein of unknown function (DUF2613)